MSLEALAEVDAAFPWFFPTVVFVFGAAVGSFLNVCIYRIPLERSVVTPRSACACGKPIAWYDNIPILSWVLLRGRARCCGRKFSFRYPFVELLTALLFVACWVQHPPIKAAAGMFLTAMLIIATFIDIDHMIIPDRCSIGAAALGVVICGVFPAVQDIVRRPDLPDIVFHMQGGIESLKGWLIGAGLMVTIKQSAEAVLQKDAMGLGDVKLVGAIGAFFGWEGAVFSVFGGAVIGTLGLGGVALINMFRRKETPAAAPPPDVANDPDAAEANPKEEFSVGFGQEVWFGPMLCAGGLLYFLWLYPVVDRYFAEVAATLAGNF